MKLLISKSSIFLFFEPVGTLSNLLMSSLSTSTFKPMKSILADKLDASLPVASFNFLYFDIVINITIWFWIITHL